MSIVKGLILIFIIAILLYKILCLKKEKEKQYEYFIKTLSHDFRVATLAQLRGIEILSKMATYSLEQQELFEEIKSSCCYSLDMVNMLKQVYLFDKGELFLNIKNFRLNDVVNNIYHIISKQVFDKHLELFFNFDKNLNINADEKLVSKLILNTLITAVSHAEAQTRIIVSSKLSKDGWVFIITYQGKSLSDEECNRMCSNNARFSTVGQGIRMYLVKKIVEFHKGQIYVKNNSKNLNSFTFHIPQTYNSCFEEMQVDRELQLI